MSMTLWSQEELDNHSPIWEWMSGITIGIIICLCVLACVLS